MLLNCDFTLFIYAQANDPDADRLAVAEHQPASNGTEAHWRFFNGNEIAALLADWAWSNHCRTSGSTLDKSNCFMLASTVSSKFLASMAAKEGFKFVDTLTGFKWMGNVAQSMEQNEHKHFLFAYEVEIGFLVGNLSYDKDGVRTAAMFAEMASQIYASGSNLAQHLESLYKKYGYFVMNTSYFFSYNAANTDRLCTRLRTGAPDGGYLKRCGKFDVVRIRDATLGTDSGEADGISRLPRTPDAQMITYWFSNGATATLRNSGTEV
jgi:phosphoglucomutase/phosphoglucomutase/phosphopentomutase